MKGTTTCSKTGHKWDERSVEMTKIKRSKVESLSQNYFRGRS